MENETQPFTHGYDMHEIDTDDFIALCREIGAEPFLTINAAWDSPEVCAAWVEYCNGPAESKYGRLRAQRGHQEPYFEPVNEGAMQVHPDHTELTATGQAFALLSRHAGGKLCTVDGVEDFEAVATIDDHHVLTLTMLNLNWQEETTYSLNKCGTILESKVLQAENLLPGTPFTENPLMIHVKDDIIKAKLPPRSVACIRISLVE